MRFGCCGSLVAQNPDKTGVEIVEKIAQYGYDYIELPLAEMMELSDADFAALQSAGARRHSGREVHRVRQCRCQAGAGELRYG